jgi:hypothetical protein
MRSFGDLLVLVSRMALVLVVALMVCSYALPSETTCDCSFYGANY